MSIESHPNVVPLRPQEEQRKTDRQDNSALFQGLSQDPPPCPQWLSDDAKKHFKFIVKELKAAGLVVKIDQGVLAILATSYARMKEAEQNVQLHGEFQTTPNGYEQLSPWAVSFERHAARYEKLAKQFGITVRARQSIKIDNPNQGELDL